MTSYLNTINSEGVDLNINSTSVFPVVIGNGLTSIGGSRTFGASTIGIITGSSATFSSTVTTTGLLTASGGLTSTASGTTLGATTVGAITGTSASFSSTVGVTGLLTTSGGLTSTTGTTTLGASTIGAITGTSASFSSTLTASGGLTSTTGATTLGESTIGAITGTSATFSSTVTTTGLLTASGGLTSTAGATTLGASTIGAITGTSATFSTTLGVTGLLSGTSGTFSSTLTTTGLLTASGGITSNTATNNFGASTMSGQLAMGNFKITGLAAPTIATDAATKGYVDTAIQGIDTKLSCVVATTAALTLASDFENGDTIDGVTLVTGNRVLIKNQADPIENGIYTVNSSGAPSRSTDLNTGSSSAGAFTFIEKGTVNSDTGYVCTSDIGSDTVGTNSLTFVQFSSAGAVDAGTGLTKTGNTLSVNASQTQITSVGSLTSLITGAITGTSATFSTTVGITGVLSANGGISSTLSTSTSSNTSGSVTLAGGIGISNTTDATSSTNGGTITTAGGLAVAKKVFIGTTLDVAGITSLTSTDVSSSNTTGALIVSGGVGISGDLNTSGKISSSNTTTSTSNSLGSLILSGGIGISNTTDATSSTNGGTITSAGGLAIAKKAFIGTTLDVASTTSSSGFLARGSTDGIISILPQTSAGTYNFNLPTSSGTVGQVLVSGGGGSNAMQWSSPAVTAGAPQTFTSSGQNNQPTPVNVPSLSYTTGSFDINLTVTIVATTNLNQLFRLSGVLGGSVWSMTAISLTGDDSFVDFTITAGGQVQYTSSTYPGFVSLTFSWVTFSATQGLSYLALSGTTSGLITIGPQAVTNTYNFNLPTTSGIAGQVLTSQGGGSSAMTWNNIKKAFIIPGSFNGVNTQVSPANVTGLIFANGYFELEVIVTIVATTSLTQFFKLSGVFNSTTTSWFLTSTAVVGNTSDVVFTINSSGQILYTSSTYAGFSSLNISWN